MPPEILTGVIIVLVNVVWDIARKKFPWLNGIPSPVPTPAPNPTPQPKPSPSVIDPVLKVIWEILRRKFPNLPLIEEMKAEDVGPVVESLYQVSPTLKAF